MQLADRPLKRGLVRNNLTQVYAPSRKKSSTSVNFCCISTESPFRPATASPKIWLFWNPQKVKNTAPEMSKTIAAIKRYTDFLYIVGDPCSSVRDCHVTDKYTCHFSLKRPKHVNNCYSGMYLGQIVR